MSETNTKKRPASPTETEQPAKKKKKIKSTSNITTPALVRKEKTPLSKFYKWSYQDDLLLKNAVEKQLTGEEILSTVKFSVKFTLQEIKERWAALLYDPIIASKAARALNILQQTTKRVPWTPEEDEIIINEMKKKGFISFQYIMDTYKDQFHPCRTIRSLEAHFYRLKRNGVFDNLSLPSEECKNFFIELTKKLAPSKENVDKISDVEQEILKGDAEEVILSKEDTLTEKKEAKQVAKLEKEHALSAKKPETNFKDSYIFAVLEGTRTNMQISKETTLVGRKNKDFPVDIDLSMEGDAGKVSRKQATIYVVAITKANTTPGLKKQTSKYKRNFTITGQIKIKNIGKRDIIVDGERIPKNGEANLRHHSYLEFPGGLKFMMHVNETEIERWLDSRNQQVVTSNEAITNVQNQQITQTPTKEAV